MQVVRPEPEGVLADEGPLDQPHRRGLVLESGGRGGQGQVEGVEHGDRAQHVALVGGEVGQGAGDQGGEVVVEVGRDRGVAGAAEFEEAHDGEVKVEGQAVGAVGDGLADVGADEGLAVAGEAAGEVVVAVFGGEVTDEDLPPVARSGAGGTGSRHAGGGGQARPRGRSGVVQLTLEAGVSPLQA
ncbi:hypothetical protein [Streptomyces sp. NPDC058622]|uniref:hypothetical protein n=1 Tax=Streptomyces sp. NPDC058622 TaxID=3346562 RepID=UPI003665AB34